MNKTDPKELYTALLAHIAELRPKEGVDLRQDPIAQLGAYGLSPAHLGQNPDPGDLGDFTPKLDIIKVKPAAQDGVLAHELRHRAYYNNPSTMVAGTGEEIQNRLIDLMQHPGALGEFVSKDSPNLQGADLLPKNLQLIMQKQAIADALGTAKGLPRSYNQYPPEIYDALAKLGLTLGPVKSSDGY